MSKSVAFDRAADYYDDTRGFPPGIAPQIPSLFCEAGSLTTSSRVLEVGIGTGRIALPLARHVREVVGVDLARPMLDRLRAKQEDERVLPLLGDATRLPLASGVFDAVIGVHVFHLIPDWRGALDEVARVLAPDGRLLTGWNDGTRGDGGDDVLWKAWDEVVHTADVINVGVPRDQYLTFLTDVGWRQVGEDRRLSYPVSHTPRDFVNRLERRVWSSCWRLTDDVVARGLAAVHAAMQQHNIDPDAPTTGERSFVVQAYVPPEG